MRFEDLEVWKRAARMGAVVIRETKELRDFGFRDQITRAALSISSNIAEGFERESNRDCVKFLAYAKGSCGEVRSQTYIGMEVNYISSEVGSGWISETREISRMLAGLIRARKEFIKTDNA